MPRVYFTGRKKIHRHHIGIQLLGGDPTRFRTSIQLENYRLPRDSAVVLEAYHNTMLQRFDLGTVADCRPREELVLSNFSPNDRPRFRLRVVGRSDDPGVIVAACDSINATEADDETGGGSSLLPIRYKPDPEMRGELWRLEGRLNYAYELWINRDIEPFCTAFKGGPNRFLLLGSVLPVVVRMILEQELCGEGAAGSDAAGWLGFARQFNWDPIPEDEEDAEARDEWIDVVLENFCKRQGRFIERLLAESEHGA